jgi:uncharacterized protein DUF6281
MRLRTATALALVAAAGCGDSQHSPEEAVGGSASCAPALEYDGHLYLGYRAGERVVPDVPLGRGSLPSCDDVGPDVDPEPAEDIEVAGIVDVPPSVAVLWQDRGDDLVYVREDAEIDSLPPDLVEH